MLYQKFINVKKREVNLIYVTVKEKKIVRFFLLIKAPFGQKKISDERFEGNIFMYSTHEYLIKN